MPRASSPAGSPRADVLGELVLPDHDGRPTRLRDLWADRPAVLVWLRHYGWVHCRDHAVQLHRARQQFDRLGVRLVLIGMGTPRHAAQLRRRLGLELPLLADADRVSYRAASARLGSLGRLLGPRSVTRAAARTVRSAGKVRQGRPVGHVAQLGGALVVTPGGEVVWSRMAEDASDNATPAELLEAVRAACAPTRGATPPA